MVQSMTIPIYANTIKRQSIDMTLSENPLGCSPSAKKALQFIGTSMLSRYPDTTNLTTFIASKLKVTPQNILVDSGSEPIIKLFCQTMLNQKNGVCIQSGSFPVFFKEASLSQNQVVLRSPQQISLRSPIPERVIFLNSPNNPTGELIPPKIVTNIIKNNPESVILLDQANLSPLSKSTIKLLDSSPNLIILRSCSKILGLAGIRVGFAVSNPTLIKKLRDSQVVFPVSSIACTIAIKALQDTRFVLMTKRYLKNERRIIEKRFDKLGLNYTQSVTQNMFISSPQANRLVKQLNKQGISVIPGSMFPGLSKPGFRISLRDKRTNRKFMFALTKAKQTVDKIASEKVVIGQ
jgi:histidinol-phosphate aminotransferase